MDIAIESEGWKCIMEDLREGVLCSARQKSEVPRLWFVIVKKKLFSLNKSAKLQVA